MRGDHGLDGARSGNAIRPCRWRPTAPSCRNGSLCGGGGVVRAGGEHPLRSRQARYPRYQALEIVYHGGRRVVVEAQMVMQAVHLLHPSGKSYGGGDGDGGGGGDAWLSKARGAPPDSGGGGG